MLWKHWHHGSFYKSNLKIGIKATESSKLNVEFPDQRSFILVNQFIKTEKSSRNKQSNTVVSKLIVAMDLFTDSNT